MTEVEKLITALISELRRLNDNIELHNDIMINHYETIGELTEFPEIELDS